MRKVKVFVAAYKSALTRNPQRVGPGSGVLVNHPRQMQEQMTIFAASVYNTITEALRLYPSVLHQRIKRAWLTENQMVPTSEISLVLSSILL